MQLHDDLVPQTLAFLTVAEVVTVFRASKALASRRGVLWKRWADAYVHRRWDANVLRLAHILGREDLQNRVFATQSGFDYAVEVLQPLGRLINEDLAIAAWNHQCCTGFTDIRHWLEIVARHRLFRLLRCMEPQRFAGWCIYALMEPLLTDGDLAACDLVWEIAGYAHPDFGWLYKSVLLSHPVNGLALAWIGRRQRFRCSFTTSGLQDHGVIALTEVLGARRVKWCGQCMRFFVYANNFGTRRPWTHRGCGYR